MATNTSFRLFYCLAALLVVLCLFLWLRPSCVLLVYQPPDDYSEGVANSNPTTGTGGGVTPKVHENTSLVDLLEQLEFNNYGTVSNTDSFTWKETPCVYLESQNVSGPYEGWADREHFNYLYQSVSGELLHPPSGMRSSVPLGGISTGSFELRGDGTFHEWLIFNQHPAGAAKIQIIDEVFMGIRTSGEKTENVSLVLQTHPIDTRLPAVESLIYRGAYPVSKLDVRDARLPIEMSVYAYSRYKHNDMNSSATPAVAFTAVMENPSDEEVTASFLFNLPLGIEPHTQRVAQQMSDDNTTFGTARTVEVSSALDCFGVCNAASICSSWSYDIEKEICQLFGDVRLNGHNDSCNAGVKGTWSVVDNCITLDRAVANSSANGNISLCVFSSDEEVSISLGTANDSYSMWTEFEKDGKFTKPTSGYHVTGAAVGTVTLAPKEKKEVTIVMGWYYPDRDFLGLHVGNYYSHLVKDSVDAANKVADQLTDVVSDIEQLHIVFFRSSIPTPIQDMLINSLSHVRSAFWLKDGRWRQWEAFDCVNLDSVHNDGERHIPYIMIFPNSTLSKLQAWAKFQLGNGMIQEQLRCGCQSLPLSPKEVEFGCGRVMSDVSSMFIVYLLELWTWHQNNYTRSVVKELWPNAVKAAEWHMNVSAEYGIPRYMVTTYDVLGLSAYPFATYSGAFHLLAMKAAETLAYELGDIDFAEKCNAAFVQGQEMLDHFLWNDTAQYYNAYSTNGEFIYENFVSESGVELCDYIDVHADSEHVLRRNGKKQPCLEGRPTTPGAVMADTFYAQVLAYSLGLGTLVMNEERLRLHMKAELQYNDSPHGLRVMTGRYPPPGPWTDNAVWMMGNPNWATINSHLDEDPQMVHDMIHKTFDKWRSHLNDMWNVAGILTGTLYADSLPYITSHYGYFMSSWHLVMALSGQKANMTEMSITFDPKVEPSYVLPVILPGVWGYLESNLVEYQGVTRTYHTLAVIFGSVELKTVAVGKCSHTSGTPFTLGVDTPLQWFC